MGVRVMPSNRRSIDPRGRFAAALTAVALGLAVSGCATSEPRVAAPLEESLAATFTLVGQECPSGYALLDDAAIIRQMGLSGNPDYIENPSEISAIEGYGGMTPILAVYGAAGEVCLLINGIFFPQRDALERFIEVHAKKPALRLAALEKPEPDGSWLILCAVDPKRTYSEREQAAIRQSIEQHSRGIGARILYSSLWSDAL